MEYLALILVLCSGLAHSVWNLFTKSSIHKGIFMWLIHLLSFIILLPFLVIEFVQKPIPLEAYLFLALTITIQGCYCMFLTKAYQYGDMSQVYPLMRGMGAFLIPVLSILIYDESLSFIGWAGLIMIVVGMFSISGIKLNNGSVGGRGNKKGLGFAILVSCCIAGYTLVDKQLLNYLSPIALIEVANIAYLIPTTFVAIYNRGHIGREWRANTKKILLGSILSPGSYLLFLFAMQLAPLAHISPVREMGTVFGTLLAIVVLKEKQGPNRIIWSSVIAFGIMTVGLFGG